MADTQPSLEELHDLLIQATKLLDRGANLCRDLQFNSSENIRSLGEAMSRAFEITHQIYEARPDLAPDWWKEWKAKQETK